MDSTIHNEMWGGEESGGVFVLSGSPELVLNLGAYSNGVGEYGTASAQFGWLVGLHCDYCRAGLDPREAA